MDSLTPEQEAASLSTTSERLQELAVNSEDENVLRAIAANPNTSPELLLKLGEHFPQEMLDNPMFNLLLLENPLDFVAQMPIYTVIRLLRLEERLSFLEQGILRHEERKYIAKNRSTPISILKILSQDVDSKVRCEVARNANTPVSILEILAQDVDAWVRSKVTKNINTPVSLLEILAQDAVQEIRMGATKSLNFKK